MKLLTILLLTSVSALAQTSQRQSDDEHFQGVQRRGEAHQGMGFSQKTTTHHFILTSNGGYIQVTASDPKDRQSVEKVRRHFGHIAGQFAQGDFAIPHFVHDQNPPGVVTMKRLKDQITYATANLDGGAELVITTHSPQALAAIHDFLRFQIKDHRTGDPLNVTAAAR